LACGGSGGVLPVDW